MKELIFLLTFVTLINCCFSEEKLDSIEKKLAEMPNDTDRVNTLNYLSWKQILADINKSKNIVLKQLYFQKECLLKKEWRKQLFFIKREIL